MSSLSPLLALGSPGPYEVAMSLILIGLPVLGLLLLAMLIVNLARAGLRKTVAVPVYETSRRRELDPED